MSSRFQQKRKYLVGVLVLVLIVSVSLNLYNHFVVIPEIQTTVNNIMIEVLREWKHKMNGAKNELESAETNSDVYVAMIRAGMASGYLEICLDEIDYSPGSFYHLIRDSTWGLWFALNNIYYTSATTRNLTQYELSNIEKICQAIDNIYLLMKIEKNGVDPVQQLEEEDLTDIIFGLRKIDLASQNIVSQKY